MSDEKQPTMAEVQQKSYDALKSYRDEWSLMNIEKLVNEGVLKPVWGGYEVVDLARLPEAAKKHLKSVKPNAKVV